METEKYTYNSTITHTLRRRENLAQYERDGQRSYLMRTGWMVRLYWDIHKAGERLARRARKRI
jgi:hypothetical protein